MYGRAMGGMRGLVYCLRHRRMGVNRAYQFFDRRLELQRQRRFSHELGGAQADHVDAEHFVVFLVGDDLHEPFGLSRHLGAAQDAERKRSDPHLVAASLRLALSETDGPDLGIAIGAAGNMVVVERPRFPARS